MLRLLNSDLYEICVACCDGSLDEIKIEWSPVCSIGIVVASQGYPGTFTKGVEISSNFTSFIPISHCWFLDIPENTGDVITFFAGVKKSEDGILENSGGRVLCVTGIGKSFYEAKSKALEAVEKINFSEKFYRRDIGRFAMSKR